MLIVTEDNQNRKLKLSLAFIKHASLEPSDRLKEREREG